jgi:phospholipase C
MAPLSTSIRRALAIEPTAGSTFLDAEHVVILMQENRSFDHAFGSLRGVRGFNDPRAVTLPDGNPVWIQTDAEGHRYAPFRLNIHETKATWMGSLPHGRGDQVEARNHGRHDRWLIAKRSGNESYSSMPLTLGHYTREDIPFYYELADAFTICDQHFCSAITCTTPNRCYLWTGTVREHQRSDSPPKLDNSQIDHDSEVSWGTFPERLEDAGVPWKIYQNEIALPTGLSEEEDRWLSNFGDNPIEHFTHFNLRFAPAYRRHLAERAKTLPREIEELKKQLAGQRSGRDAAQLAVELAKRQTEHAYVQSALAKWSRENFDKLSPRERRLHDRAFTVNSGDPAYRQLEELVYDDNGAKRAMRAPKADLFHQFRQDFTSGSAPAVSWLVAPQAFSDHPDTAWFGAWYVAEALDILTQNPEVWKKTIFILTYDENDGYFDHVPPFVAPHPDRSETGLASRSVDTSLEHVELGVRRRARGPGGAATTIGLGYRVPLIIASPWTRGGCVCSQVFDHTSSLQFLERWLSQKHGREIKETNITSWRRAVCGDLTSAFQRAPTEGSARVTVPDRNTFLKGIHRAQFKEAPDNFKALTNDEVEELRRNAQSSLLMPQQEPGVRRSCPLPYELNVDGKLSPDRTAFIIQFTAGEKAFGAASAGSPFAVRALTRPGDMAIRDYAVAAGESVEDSWPLNEFEGGRYDLKIYGPNGFFRAFRGSSDDPQLDISFQYSLVAPKGEKLTGDVEVIVENHDQDGAQQIEIIDNAYKSAPERRKIDPAGRMLLTISCKPSHGWYDFSVRLANASGFEKRYAGRVETGEWGISDPALAGANS